MQIYCYLNCVSFFLSLKLTDSVSVDSLIEPAACLPFPIKSHHLADKRASERASKQGGKSKRTKRREIKEAKEDENNHNKHTKKEKKHIWQTLVKCIINRSRQQLTLFGQFAAARQSICSRPAHSHNSTIMVRKMVNVCVRSADSLNRFDRWWWSLRGMGTTTTAAGDAAVWLVSLVTTKSDSGSAVSPGERLIRR